MNWDNITLYVLAGFGIVLLALGQLRDLLGKLAEVVIAWQELQSSMRRRADPQDTPPVPQQQSLRSSTTTARDIA